MSHTKHQLTKLQQLTTQLATILPTATQRAHNDTHSGIAPNGPTANDGSRPGPTPTLATQSTLTRDHTRQHHRILTQELTRALHHTHLALNHAQALLPLPHTTAQQLTTQETIDPPTTPCSNPNCTDNAQTNRTQCRACRAYQHKHGTNRPKNLCQKSGHQPQTSGHSKHIENIYPTHLT